MTITEPVNTTTWKLIVAAEAPWTGEVYHTRPGNHRHHFDSIESFCAGFLAVTGWPLHALSAEPTGAPHPPNRHSLRPKLLRENPSGKHKFIVAAEQPWIGQVYRTRPGLGRLHFTTFEDFLRSVVTLTGWSVDSATEPQRLSRPA
jgi:hypothetical protein